MLKKDVALSIHYYNTPKFYVNLFIHAHKNMFIIGCAHFPSKCIMNVTTYPVHLYGTK